MSVASVAALAAVMMRAERGKPGNTKLLQYAINCVKLCAAAHRFFFFFIITLTRTHKSTCVYNNIYGLYVYVCAYTRAGAYNILYYVHVCVYTYI